MQIQYLEKKSPRRQDKAMMSMNMDALVRQPGTRHCPKTAEILCASSFWAYSDLQTFAAMMSCRGLHGEYVSICLKNDPAFVDSTAYLFVSEDKKLAILSFGGTEPLDFVQWLGGMNTTIVNRAEGGIHCGFMTAAQVVLPMVGCLLLAWENGQSLMDGLEAMRDKTSIPEPEFLNMGTKAGSSQGKQKGGAAKKGGGARKKGTQESADSDRALYITGHGFGGGMAFLAGAMLSEPTFEPVKNALRSIYTFGAPMVVDATLANKLEQEIGNRVFRHRFRNDVVPSLPHRRVGNFKHFGVAYECSRDGGWAPAMRQQMPALSSLSLQFAFTALRRELVAILPGLPPLLWSFPDHFPLRYMAASQTARPSFEILGAEFGGDVLGGMEDEQQE